MTKIIENSIRSLRGFGVAPKVAKTLGPAAAAFVIRLNHDVINSVDAFTDSANPDIAPELQQHLQKLADDVCRTLAGKQTVDFDPVGGQSTDFRFVRRYAIRRAEQKFPLDALLKSMTLMHRAFAPWVRDAALTVAAETAQLQRVVTAVDDFMGAYFSVISSIMTSEYVQRTRTLAEVEGDRRTELFNLLLQGCDESDSYAAQLLRRAGYLEQRQSFCIVAAQSVEPKEMENRARARRMADSVSSALADLPIRSLVSIRDNLVTAVISGRRRQSGWTTPQSKLADRIYAQLRKIGPAALIGVSTDVPSTAHIPRALSEAKLALGFASVSERVMPFSHIPFQQILVHLARHDIQSALPGWLVPFLAADRKSRGALRATLQTYADADMNVLQTAKVLSLHPNTIYARLQKIEDITGKNGLKYNALTELLLVADCADMPELHTDVSR